MISVKLLISGSAVGFAALTTSLMMLVTQVGPYEIGALFVVNVLFFTLNSLLITRTKKSCL